MAHLLWLLALTVPLTARAEFDACLEAGGRTLWVYTCMAPDEAGTRCQHVRLDLADGGMTPVRDEEGSPATPKLAKTDAGCAPVRPVGLAGLGLEARVSRRPFRYTVEEAAAIVDGGIFAISPTFSPTHAERSLKLVHRAVTMLEWPVTAVSDAATVEGLDVGDHRHLIVLFRWRAPGFEDSSFDALGWQVVTFDASRGKWGKPLEASLDYDPWGDTARWEDAVAASLGGEEARPWRESARDHRLRSTVTRRPEYLECVRLRSALRHRPDSAEPDALALAGAEFTLREVTPRESWPLIPELLHVDPGIFLTGGDDWFATPEKHFVYRGGGLVLASDPAACTDLTPRGLKGSAWKVRSCDNEVQLTRDRFATALTQLGASASTGDPDEFEITRAGIHRGALELAWQTTSHGKNGDCSGSAGVTVRGAIMCDAAARPTCKPKGEPSFVAGASCVELDPPDGGCGTTWLEELTLSDELGERHALVRKTVIATDAGTVLRATPLDVTIPTFDANDRPSMRPYVLAQTDGGLDTSIPPSTAFPQFISSASPRGDESRFALMVPYALGRPHVRREAVRHALGRAHRFEVHEGTHDDSASMGGVGETWDDEVIGTIVTLDETGRIVEAHLSYVSTYQRTSPDWSKCDEPPVIQSPPVVTRSRLELTSRCDR